MSRVLAYAQLVRLPNSFTAMADILLGTLALGAASTHPAALVCLLGASVSLYSAGMVWNDFFDWQQDARERPFRPIPSGRVSRRAAGTLGVWLLVIGVVLASLADLAAGAERYRATIIAGWLVVVIFLYDAWLKRTALGPVAMGACRFLNVLLGLTVTGTALPGWGYLLALTVGTYIAGVTWFARTEARASNVNALMGAAAVMLAGLLLGLGVPALAHAQESGPSTAPGFPYLLAAFGAYVGVALVRAIRKPLPQFVQPAVKRSVLGLVLLDAILASALVGWMGLAIVALLAPARLVGRWVYST